MNELKCKYCGLMESGGISEYHYCDKRIIDEQTLELATLNSKLERLLCVEKENDRLKRSLNCMEAERHEQCRIIGISGSTELRLITELATANRLLDEIWVAIDVANVNLDHDGLIEILAKRKDGE